MVTAWGALPRRRGDWAGLVVGACLVLGGCGEAPADDSAAGAAAGASGEASPATIVADVATAPGPAPWPEGAPPIHKGLWVGSWAPREAEGFDEMWVDEPGLRKVFTKDLAGRRRWAGATGDGVLPVELLVRDREGPAIAYAYTLLSRSHVGDDPYAEGAFPDQPAVLHLRHQGRVRVRLDGEVVLDVPAPLPGAWGTARAAVTLTAPYDVLLVKLGRGSPELGSSMAFEIRVSDPSGQPIPGQGWNSMRPPGLPTDL